MARQKKSKTPRRKDKAVSLTGLAEALMLANVGTRAAFGLSAWDWATDGWTANSAGKAHGAGQLSLHELIYGNYSGITTVGMAGGSGYGSGGSGSMAPIVGGGNTPAPSLLSTPNMDIVTENIKNNWLPAVIQGVAIPVGFKLGKRFLRKPITMGNKLFKQIGVRGMVKI